ncbi:unnamed protein product [Closterium sp. NIES-64]|nr:unnamed protein product [Closterium sp. NIES-64]
MVGAVGDAGVVGILEAQLENAKRRHEANKYGDLPWAVVKAGLRTMWATEHPSRHAFPRPVNDEGGVDVGVHAGGGQVGSGAGGTSRQRGMIHAVEAGGVQARGLHSSAAAGSSRGDVGGHRSGLSPMSATHVTVGGIAPSYGYFKFMPDRILLEMAGLIGFACGTMATPEEHYPDLRAEIRAEQLLTFTVISRCCSPGVQIALKWCREHLDAGHRAWHFIESTYQVTDDLFITQLEGQLTHVRMGDEENATDYCNRARQILATIRMACVQYSTSSYVTHVMQGLSSSYNLLKRLSMAPSTRATLNEDNLTLYILQDEAMQEAERSQELLADSDDDDAKGGRVRSSSRRPRRGGNHSRKEKQSTTSISAKDADSSAGGKGRHDKTTSCLLVGVVEPTVSLAPEAGEDF